MPLVSKHCCQNGRASLCTPGSFHSDDVEVLVRQDAATYTPPALPFLDPAEQRPAQEACSSRQGSCWGANARSQFQIDFGSWSFINHGAFGGASRCGCLVLCTAFLVVCSRCVSTRGLPLHLHQCVFCVWLFAPCRAASESAQLWRAHCEAQPLRFIDRWAPRLALPCAPDRPATPRQQHQQLLLWLPVLCRQLTASHTQAA